MEADDLLRRLIDVLDELEIPYALGGSVAAVAYGEPRATLDIDVVCDLRESDLARLRVALPPPEFYLSEDAALDAIHQKGQFNIIHPSSGFKVDVFVLSDDIERSQLAHRRRLPALADRMASFSPPEELIIKKLEYYHTGGSDKHLRDIRSMLEISSKEIDTERISRLAEMHGLSALWAAVVATVRAL